MKLEIYKFKEDPNSWVIIGRDNHQDIVFELTVGSLEEVARFLKSYGEGA